MSVLLAFNASQSVALAQKPWEKPAASWTDADARRILSDSPWAKRVTVKCGDSKNSSALVRWEDSQPIREALLKIGVLPAAEDAASYTAVAVRVFEEGSAGCSLQGLESWTKSGILRLPVEKQPIQTTSIRILKENDEVTLIVFLFPRTANVGEPKVFRLPGVVLHSSQIVFEARVGPLEIRQAFPLQYMYYLGKFEF
jgi:hypothetical protein